MVPEWMIGRTTRVTGGDAGTVRGGSALGQDLGEHGCHYSFRCRLHHTGSRVADVVFLIRGLFPGLPPARYTFQPEFRSSTHHS